MLNLQTWKVEVVDLRPEKDMWLVTLDGPVVPESEEIVKAEWPEGLPPYEEVGC